LRLSKKTSGKPQQDTSPTGRTARILAGRQKLQQDGPIHQQDRRNFSRTTLYTGRTIENSTGRRHLPAGRQKTQQGEWQRAFRVKTMLWKKINLNEAV
jgi:hypothetical protein